MTVFRGTTSQCLTHLFSTKFDKDVNEALAEFVGREAKSTLLWKKGETAPQGESLIKARCFLELLGYSVSELRALNPSILKLGRIYAYGLVSAQDIAQKLAYTARPKTVLEIMTGKQGLRVGRRKVVESIVASFGSKPDEARKKLVRHLPIPQNDPPVTERAIPVAKPEITRALVDHTVATLSSLSTLVGKTDLRRSSIYDGDKMLIQRDMQRICESLGVPSHFPDLNKRGTSVTAAEMAGPRSKRSA